MFYVSKINGNIIEVTDSDDGIAENYTIQQLSEISKNISIQGFIDSENIFKIDPLDEVLRHFKYGDITKGLRFMGTYGLELVFRGKPRNMGDGTSFVTNRGIRLFRNYNGDYSYYDENNRYRSNFSFAEIYDVLKWYYSFGTLISINLMK